MAEAHAAVAFTFTVSSEGLNVVVNTGALNAVLKSGVLALKKRTHRFKVYKMQPSIPGIFPSAFRIRSIIKSIHYTHRVGSILLLVYSLRPIWAMI